MFVRRLSWRLAEAINRAGFLLFSRLSVIGKENVPRKGGLLVVSNHLSMSDIPLLAAGLPRKLVFVGKQELWRIPVMRMLGDWYDCFPIDRTTTDMRALKRSLQALAHGGALVLFPEGTRSLDGKLLPGHPGAALIALYADARILPVAITGTDKARGMSWLWRRPGLTVSIGKPFKLDRAPGEHLKGQLAPATDTIMRKIASLLPEEREGEYAPGRMKGQ